MGHTNSTANLSLPQFIGTDKPTWLGDVNGAFSAIDGYVGTNDAAVAAAASDASSAISQAAAAVNTANTANTTAGNASTAATAAVTAANQANALSNQIALRTGVLADLTTTDKTSIVNAINEVNATAQAAGTPVASAVTYDNSGSGLTATDVQSAIDELAQGGGGSVTEKIEVTGDGTKSIGTLLDELYALIDSTKISVRSVLTFVYNGANYVLRIGRFIPGNYYRFGVAVDYYSYGAQVLASSSKFTAFTHGQNSDTDQSSTAIAAGVKVTLYH